MLRLVPKPGNVIFSQWRSTTAASFVPQVFQRKTMDLHGLHVAEAVEVLDREMGALAERGLCSVRVLTGTGHHSKGPTNKVKHQACVTGERDLSGRSRKSNRALLAARGFLPVVACVCFRLVVFFFSRTNLHVRLGRRKRFDFLWGIPASTTLVVVQDC